MKKFRDFQAVINRYTPHIHNLPNCVYIRWVDKEWFLEKGSNKW